MRKLIPLIIMLGCAVIVIAQPTYYNHASTTGGVNIFPFNVNPATGKRVQWVITPAGSSGGFNLPSPAPPGNNITTIWFWANNANNATYNNLTIKLATVSTSTFISTGAFYSGPMTTVFSQNKTLSSPAANSWVGVTLTTPYLYDPTMNLIIEVSQCGYTGTGFSVRQVAYGTAPNYRRQYSDAASLCGAVVLPTGGDLNVAGIGISVVPATQPCAENFDGVVAPALPPSWAASTLTTCAGSLPWATDNTVSNSAPNSAFTNDPNCISDEILDSKIFPIVSPTAQLTFKNNYNLESTFDGMVLEISIGGGPFTDIITAGGSFVAGGYNGTISSLFGSPIGGRQAWTGNSGGFITTTVNLPAAANGQSVVIRWRRATDSSVGATGVWIDDVTLTGSDCAGACVITCPANITVSNSPNQCGAVVNYPAPTTNGACGPITSSPASGSFFPVGNTIVNVSAFANRSCSFIVRVNDVQPPVITCPANMTVNNSPGICGAVVNFAPTASDNCPGTVVTSVPASGSLFPIGTTTVTSTATDASGNTATCTFTVTVRDTEAPTFTSNQNFPERLYYKFDGSGVSVPNLATTPPPGTANGVLTGLTQGSTGKCGTALVGTGVANQKMNTGWITNMNGPWTISFWLGPNQVDANPSYLFGDVTTTTGTTGAFRCFYGGAAGANNVLLRGGNADVLITGVNPAATFITIVYNGTNTVVYKNGASPQTYAVTFANTSATGPFTVGGYSTLASINGRMDEFSMYTHALSAAEVLSIYNNCPTATNTCPSNITVNNTPGACNAVVNYTTPVGVDNCPGVTTTQIAGLPSGSTFPLGTTSNTYRATDAAGNTANCTFTVTVVDAQAPTINCPANITVNTPVGACNAVVNYNVTATDNCGGATTSLVSGIASGGTFPLGTTTNTWKATDAAGNTSTCSFTVLVNDAQFPVIATQPSNKIVCEGTNATFSVIIAANPSPVNYQWQQWNGTAWVNIAGATASTYTINNVTIAMNTNTYRVNVIGLCNSVISSFATLYVNKLPLVTLTSSRSPALIPGQFLTLTVNASPTGGTVVWRKNGNVITGYDAFSMPNLTVDDIGSYTATYTDQNGCSVTSNTVSITAQSYDKLFVYPNPNNGQFQIRFYNQSGQAVSINIFDERGARVYHRSLVTGQLSYSRIDVDLSKVSNGVYIAELLDASGNKIGSKRFVIGH